MAAATVYLACKSCRVLRSLAEIVAATGAQNSNNSYLKLTSKYYRMLIMDLGGNMQQQFSVDHYISKLANMAKIDAKVERLAVEMAHETEDHVLADGKDELLMESQAENT